VTVRPTEEVDEAIEWMSSGDLDAPVIAEWLATVREQDTGWISVEDRLDMEREDNCCLDIADVERYSVVGLVWDEDIADVLRASYDFREKVWNNADTGDQLHGVTHRRPLPAPPVEERA